MLFFPHHHFGKKRNPRKRIHALFLFLLAFFFLASAAIGTGYAQTVGDDRFGVGFGINAGLGTRDIRETVVLIIRSALGVLGVIALGIMLYGGFVWMTAGGRSERIDLARKILINAAIGLLIIFTAFAIVQFVFKTLQEGTGIDGGDCTPGACTRCGYICDAGGNEIPSSACNTQSLCGTLPGGDAMTLRWASPAPGETDVALCRMIQAYFSHTVEPSSVTENSFTVTVATATQGAGASCSLDQDCRSGSCSGGTCQGASVAGTRKVSGKAVQFVPAENYLVDTTYRVVIAGGLSGVRSDAASGDLPLDREYEWTFSTGSTQDTEPPQVIQVDPPDGNTNVCLASPLQAVFNEPMDVVSLLATGNDPNDAGSVNSIYLNPPLLPGVTWSKTVPQPDRLSAAPTDLLFENTAYTSTLDADVIADACGNFLDGDGDGTAEGSAGGDDYDWGFTTGVTAVCTPEIESISPAQGEYNDQIVISGRHFTTVANDVIFSQEVSSVQGCFSPTSFFPQNACIDSWTDRQITVRVPAGGGITNGAVSGGVRVEVAGNESNSSFFDVTAPHINAGPLPVQGGYGQYITIQGIQFGTTEGSIFLKSVSDPSLEYAADRTDCSVSSWRDSEVVVKIPAGIPLGQYYIQMERSDGSRSNIAPEVFEVTSDAPGPGLCGVSPVCPSGNSGGSVGDLRTLEGVRFGTSPGTVWFGTAAATSFSSWGDTEIRTAVPSGVITGNNPVTAEDSAGKVSNPVGFVSPCDLGVSCDPDPTSPACEIGGACPRGQTCNTGTCTCEAIPETPSQPEVVSRWPDCGAFAVCTEVMVGVRFSEEMETASLNGNMEVVECADASCTSFTGVSFSQIDAAANPEIQFINLALRKGSSYRVFVSGGNAGVQSKAGQPLDIGSLNYDRDGDGSPDAYSYTFRTRVSGCNIDQIDVSPSRLSLVTDTTAVYETYVYEENSACSGGVVRLNPASFSGDFIWNACAVADPSGCPQTPTAGCPSASSFASVTEQANDWRADVRALLDRADPVFVCSLYSDGISGVNKADGGELTIRPRCTSDAQCQAGGCSESVCVKNGPLAGTCTPDITAVVPSDGAVGNWVTIQGCYFGNTKGTVEFAGSAGRVPARYPSQSIAQCAPSEEWTDTEIIVEVPNKATPAIDDDAVTGPVYVQTADGLDAQSDGNFVVNGVVRPGLCRIVPSRGQEGDTTHLYGQGFGDTRESDDAVVFQVNKQAVVYPTGEACPSDGWDDSEICASVPEFSESGDVVVQNGAEQSNPRWFTVDVPGGGIGSPCNASPGASACTPDYQACQPGLWCDSNNSCTCQSPPPPNVSLFSPVGNSICRNSVFQVQFDQLMSFSSVASSTRPGLFLNAKIPTSQQTCDSFGFKDAKIDTDGEVIGKRDGSLWKRLVRAAQRAMRLLFGSADAQGVIECQVPVRITAVNLAEGDGCTSALGEGCTVFMMEPESVLPPKEENISYEYGVVSYTNPYFGARSIYGVRALAQSESVSAGDLCSLDAAEVIVTPPGEVRSRDIFFCAGRDDCPGDAADGYDERGNIDSSEPSMTGNQHKWTARAYSTATDPPTLIMATYAWSEDDPDNLYKLNSVNSQSVYVTPDSRNGRATFTVSASDSAGLLSSVETSIEARTQICNNPWPGVTPRKDSTYNYSFWYCQDGDLPALEEETKREKQSVCSIYSTNPGSLCSSENECPAGNQCVEGVCNSKSGNAGAACSSDADCTAVENRCESSLLQEVYWKIEGSSSSERIALRIFSNKDHLSARRWFEAFSATAGNDEDISADGYRGVKSGRTVYVNAANDSNGDTAGGSIFTNVYLLSYSQNASPELKNIYGQIVRNLEFNTNMRNAENLVLLRRDTRRLGDLGNMRLSLNEYKGKEGDYPKLLSGTYIKNISISRWPSWLSPTGAFKQEVPSLPVDPLNQWGSTAPAAGNCTLSGNGSVLNQCAVNDAGESLCCSDNTQAGVGSQCAESRCVLCPLGYDIQSCWSELEQKFFCPAGSSVYLYKYEGAGSASVYATFEYTQGKWGGISNASQEDPCSGTNSSCGCFNTKITF